MIDEALIRSIRQYVLEKTGRSYLGRIKQVHNNIMVSCPFHKGGQEQKPSCGIKTVSDEKSNIGTVHCYSCGTTTDIVKMISYMLGDSYNESEIDELFGLKTLLIKDAYTDKPRILWGIPEKRLENQESKLRTYRTYHPYLRSRNINEDTAKFYDIGFDAVMNQITFPIYDINHKCIGVGRRDIDKKQYLYPRAINKPLYGLYELPKLVRSLFVVEGPFNLWSLHQWGKYGVALLGTGTERQYKALSMIQTVNYILALDPDTAR